MSRFFNSDSIAGTLGVIGSHHLYSYCYSKPIMLVDSNGTEPTLFYFYGSDQEKHAQRNIANLESQFDVTPHMVTSEQEFMEAWNTMCSSTETGKVDIVVVHLHGNPYTVEHMNIEKMNFSLAIDTFVLLACNAGHQNTGTPNIAERMLANSNGCIKQLIAADGTHYGATFWHPLRGIRVRGDKIWKKYCNVEEAESNGFVRYSRTENGDYSLSFIGKTFKSVKALLNKVGW